MSAGLVWLVAAVVFFAFKVAFPDLPRIWLAFIYAIPAMFIVTLVLSALWPADFQLSVRLRNRLGCCAFG